MNMQKTSQQDSFAPLQGAKVAQLVTFRRNGQGVATPVGIRLANGKVYFTTWSTTGKVKRLARNPQVTLAPFTKRGMKVIGPTIEGTTRRLGEAEAKELSTRFKPSLWDRLWNLMYRLRGWQAIHYEVSPIDA
jgi:uncharacterized protein